MACLMRYPNEFWDTDPSIPVDVLDFGEPPFRTPKVKDVKTSKCCVLTAYDLFPYDVLKIGTKVFSEEHGVDARIAAVIFHDIDEKITWYGLDIDIDWVDGAVPSNKLRVVP